MRRLILTCFISFFIINCNSGSTNGEENPIVNLDVLSIGDEFPGFEEFLTCSNQDIVYDYSDSSKVILLSLFASWCSVCQSHVPNLETLYQDFADQGLVVIAAGKDMGAPYSCEEWTSNFGANYLIVDDNNNLIEQQFSAQGSVPYNVIIDKDRVIRYSADGYDESTIRSLITSTLAE